MKTPTIMGGLRREDPIVGPLVRAAVRAYQQWQNTIAGSAVRKVDGIMEPNIEAKPLERR